MDISSSQYSSASESGWTQYLDKSFISESYVQMKCENIVYERKGARMNEEESEEDLSMVSDASSGPPHYDKEYQCENLYTCLSSTTKESQKKKKVRENCASQQPSPLDDTASSQFFSPPKKSHKKHGIFSGNGALESALVFSEYTSATTINVQL